MYLDCDSGRKVLKLYLPHPTNSALLLTGSRIKVSWVSRLLSLILVLSRALAIYSVYKFNFHPLQHLRIPQGLLQNFQSFLPLAVHTTLLLSFCMILIHHIILNNHSSILFTTMFLNIHTALRIFHVHNYCSTDSSFQSPYFISLSSCKHVINFNPGS